MSDVVLAGKVYGSITYFDQEHVLLLCGNTIYTNLDIETIKSSAVIK